MCVSHTGRSKAMKTKTNVRAGKAGDDKPVKYMVVVMKEVLIAG
jgi:hypothetical protein